MTTSNGIGTALRSARVARGMSLNQVATDAGISVATLSRIETDKQNLDVGLLLTLTRILRVAPGSILDGDGERAPAVDPTTLAHDLAALASPQRAEVVAAALREARNSRGRPAVHARVDSLLTALNLIEEELRALQREVQRRERRS